MKLLSTQIRRDTKGDGVQRLDWNLVVELLTKIVILATLVYATKTAVNASNKSEHNSKAVESITGTPVEQVPQKWKENAARQK